MKRRYIWGTLIQMLLILLLAAGCGKSGASDGGVYFYHSMNDQEMDTEETLVTEPETQQDFEEQDLYLIAELNPIEESLLLYRYMDGMEYRYYYGTRTAFANVYGDRTSAANLAVGKVLCLGNVDQEGLLVSAQFSDVVWTYDDVTRFSVDDERGIFTIADSNYSYDETTYVFMGDKRVDISELNKGDTLSVVGIDRRILSVRVTTGQGTLALENTGVFEGGFLQVGTKVFAKVTPNMEILVEEGTYELVVANNGWAGSCQITIAKGRTTTVDLDKIKGEGPKKGKIKFVVDVADAVVVVDGEEIDASHAVELNYGEHSLAVYATGYDAWVRNLYVNSEKATIVIQLKEETSSDSVDTKNDAQKSTQKNQASTEPTSQSQQENRSQQESESSQSERSSRQSELELIRDLLTNSVL